MVSLWVILDRAIESPFFSTDYIDGSNCERNGGVVRRQKRTDTHCWGLELGHLPPLDAAGAGHQDLVSDGGGGRGARRGAEVSAVASPLGLQAQVREGEGLGAEPGGQVLQGGQILVHEVLQAEPAGADSVQLEAPYKLTENAADTQTSQPAVPHHQLLQGARDALLETAEGTPSHTHTHTHRLSQTL